MEHALRVVNEMARLGIIKSYAIGGGVAATYFIEPVLTYDLDIFFVPAKEGIDVLAPVYDYAREKGFPSQAEAILVKGFPVQFIPAYNDLVREAIANAVTLSYRGVEARVVSAEYLAAISLQTGRAKDRERLALLLEAAIIDRSVLDGILREHGLSEKFEKFSRIVHEG